MNKEYAMRTINKIIIHCSATRPGWMENNPTAMKVDEIRRWHVEERGWSDIGYHFLIDTDGTVAPGRPLERSGAHTKGHNNDSIGICLIGGHGASATDRFRDHFSMAQNKALRDLIDELRAEYGDLRVQGHNEFAAKGCPGFRANWWWHGDV